MNKQCTQCDETKPESEYYTKKRSKVRKDGTVHNWLGLYAACKRCVDGYNKAASHKYKDYHVQYRKNNRERTSRNGKRHYVKVMLEWIELIKTKKALECTACGYNKTWAALDFHHVDPREKENTIHSIMKSGKPTEERWALMQTELDKCVILCANCHREEHMKYNYLELDAEKVVKEYNQGK